ncbi:MAG TPA: DnaA/Hda family protein, partial [Burkholderiaceae bacterium]|nr:DnaA/Hda family protein [Burkholderiaceae bacterium]
MRQLLLDLGAEKPQTLATFVAGQNQELMQRLQALTARDETSPREHFIYLWGESGAGKSHLLRALGACSNAHYLAADAPGDAFLFTPSVTL